MAKVNGVVVVEPTYFKFVVVASTSSKKPLSFSCDIQELHPKIPFFDIEMRKSGLTCKNAFGGLLGVLRKTIGSFSFDRSQLMLAMRSKNAVTSGRLSSDLINLASVSSCVNRRGCGSRNNCDGV